jgi:hypothetical protein
VGIGLVLISTTQSYAVWVIGFGVLVGLGLGFGYSSATPPALKWFPPSKTGMVAGLVVAGFGLAPVYLAPLSEYLLRHYGLLNSMRIYGIAFTVIVCGLAQLLLNPPSGHVVMKPISGSAPKSTGADKGPAEILGTPTFWVLWAVYFIGSGAGLMVISSVSGMAKKTMGTAAFIAVAVMAIGNAAGRICAGLLSDRIGRRWDVAAGARGSIPHDADCHTGDGLGERAQAGHRPSCDRDRVQLWSQLVTLPVLREGFMGAQNVRHELWNTLHGLGRWWICLEPLATNAFRQQQEFQFIVRHRRCAAFVRGGTDVHAQTPSLDKQHAND